MINRSSFGVFVIESTSVANASVSMVHGNYVIIAQIILPRGSPGGGRWAVLQINSPTFLGFLLI
jgi:hypothetical protein